MAEAEDITGQKDRSPSYPIVPLETALERLAAFEAHFKRTPARPEKVGDAWAIKAKAHADRTAAALRYFGLLDYQGLGKSRLVAVSEMGRKYLRAQQEETKRQIIKEAALRPRQIAKFWGKWGADRPADAACLDDLVLHNGFSEGGARDFLKVYDATIRYAGLTDSDKPTEALDQDDDQEPEEVDDAPPPPGNKPPQPKGKVPVMESERVAFIEENEPGQYLKLVASGDIDDTMLEALEDYVKRQRKRLARGLAETQELLQRPVGSGVIAPDADEDT